MKRMTFIPAEWNYTEGDDITFVYHRYYGDRDENGNRIYERETMTCNSESDIEFQWSYLCGHSEVATWAGYGFGLEYDGEETSWHQE